MGACSLDIVLQLIKKNAIKIPALLVWILFKVYALGTILESFLHWAKKSQSELTVVIFLEDIDIIVIGLNHSCCVYLGPQPTNVHCEASQSDIRMPCLVRCGSILLLQIRFLGTTILSDFFHLI